MTRFNNSKIMADDHPINAIDHTPPTRHRDPAYLDHLCTQPCRVTGLYGNALTDPVLAVHLTWGTDGDPAHLPSDSFAIPLLRSEYKTLQLGEMSYWLMVINQDPSTLCRLIKDAERWRYFSSTARPPA